MSFSPSRLVCPRWAPAPAPVHKQPIWAAGDTPHLMPVEQGFPWHPVATGLAGQAIPFIVAATHAHALPSPPFWFPVPAVLVASLALLCPSSWGAGLCLDRNLERAIPPPPPLWGEGSTAQYLRVKIRCYKVKLHLGEFLFMNLCVPPPPSPPSSTALKAGGLWQVDGHGSKGKGSRQIWHGLEVQEHVQV